MLQIISGTNRPGSNTLQVARFAQGLYREIGVASEIIDLMDVEMNAVTGHYGESVPQAMQTAISKVNRAEGVVVVCPEYNGSYPGVLKYFIDHWVYPDSFEFRPVSFIGLGGRFGALRPVEHLQGVFGYRNGFVYPERIFLFNIGKLIKDGAIIDQPTVALMRLQVAGFHKFMTALAGAGLDANSRLKAAGKI